MKTRWLVLATALWMALSAAAQALDTVRTLSGPVAGEIKEMSPVQVTVQQAAIPKKVAVNEIQWIIYEGEPSSLNTARMAISGGRFQDALDILNDPQKLPAAQVNERAVIKQDVEFYKALCTAKLALAGQGEIGAAGKRLIDFINSNPGNYHYLQANELVGDLLVADGKYAAAEPFYRKLEQAPWDDYKMRAGVAIARGKLAQGDLDAAEKEFDKVLAVTAEGPQAEFQRMNAQLGKARCVAEKGNAQKAKATVEEIIAKADPEHVDLHARAYNTLGMIERKADNPKAAILAYLHVDLLYFAEPEQHAEALANLEELWNEVHKPERAIKARQILDDRYKNSRWAQKK